MGQIHMTDTESDPNDGESTIDNEASSDDESTTENESATDNEASSDDETAVDDETTTDSDERTTIHTGRNFEQTYRLSAAEAGDFLIAVGEQLREGEELTITDEEWELPFAFGEPVTVELDFEGMDDPELELEIELPGRPDDTAPQVE